MFKKETHYQQKKKNGNEHFGSATSAIRQRV